MKTYYYNFDDNGNHSSTVATYGDMEAPGLGDANHQIERGFEIKESFLKYDPVKKEIQVMKEVNIGTIGNPIMELRDDASKANVKISKGIKERI